MYFSDNYTVETSCTITEAARQLGSIKTERKAQKARENGKLGGRPPRGPHEKQIADAADGTNGARIGTTKDG